MCTTPAIAGVSYRFGTDAAPGYTYLRNGALTSMRLPTGRVLTYGFDSVGWPKSVGDGAKQYVSDVGYTDHGAMGVLRMNGQMLRERRSYDPLRPQLTGIALERCLDNSVGCGTVGALRTLGYGYVAAGGGNGGGPNNNGNVRTQTISDPGAAGVTQVYGYDGLNRLTTFTEGSLGETNCYDEHGNRAVLQRVGLSPLVPQVTQCTASAVRALFPGNRWAMTSYDAAGGIGNDGRSMLRYDAEDRVVKTWPAGGGAETVYGYDGEGKRVTAGGVVFVYDGFGKLAAEYGSAVSGTGLEYLGVDHLGSTRALVGADGTVTRRLDYWPFGMEMSGVDTAWRTAGLGFGVDGRVRAKFTGQMRDEGTGLDYFWARYFSGAMGRFASPDPYVFQFAAASHTRDQEKQNQLRHRYISNPQVWNKYAYGLNNPLKFVDPTGRCSKPSGQKEGETGICIEAFIAKSWFKLVGRGDGRTFSGTDASQTARSRIKLTVDGKGNVTSQNVESARSGVLVKGMGLQGDTVAKVESKGNQDGSV